MRNRPLVAGFACASKLRLVYTETQIWLGHLPRNGGDQEKTVSSYVPASLFCR